MRFYLGGALDTSLELTAPAVTNPGTWFFGAHGRVEAPEALLANVEVYPNLLGEDGVRRAGQRALAELPAVRPKPPMPVLWQCDEAAAPLGSCASAFLAGNGFRGTLEAAHNTSAVRRWVPPGGGPGAGGEATCRERWGTCSAGAPEAYGERMYRRGVDMLQASMFEPSWARREALLEEALNTFSGAAAYGRAEAHWRTAVLALSGLSSKWPDEASAEAFAVAELLHGAAAGDAACQIALGRRSLAGEGVPQSLEAGLFFYEQAGEQAYQIYREPGKQVLPEYVELTEKIHLKRGDHRGERDQVTEYLANRAEKGDGNAMVTLGQRYYGGTHGLEQDLGRALEYFQAADRQGNQRGTLGAAKMLLKGEGAPKDVNASKAYFGSVIERGGDGLAAEAYNGLGFMFYTGSGGVQNYSAALQMFSRAADVGSVDGHVNTAIMAAAGLGTPDGVKNATLAYSMYSKVAGNPGPAYHAAKAESGGVGTVRNAGLAAHHFKVITATGPWTRSLAKGVKAYLSGDLLESLLWYTQAGELGLRVGVLNQVWVIDELKRRARTWNLARLEALLPGRAGREEKTRARGREEGTGLVTAAGFELNMTKLELTRLKALRGRILRDEGVEDVKRGWAVQQLGHAAEGEEEREALYARAASLGDIQSHFDLAEIRWARTRNITEAAELYTRAHATPGANTAATAAAWALFRARAGLHMAGQNKPASLHTVIGAWALFSGLASLLGALALSLRRRRRQGGGRRREATGGGR